MTAPGGQIVRSPGPAQRGSSKRARTSISNSADTGRWSLMVMVAWLAYDCCFTPTASDAMWRTRSVQAGLRLCVSRSSAPTQHHDRKHDYALCVIPERVREQPNAEPIRAETVIDEQIGTSQTPRQGSVQRTHGAWVIGCSTKSSNAFFILIADASCGVHR